MTDGQQSEQDDLEQQAFSQGMALANAVIRAMGGDPKHPTKEQAKAAASLILAIAPWTDQYAAMTEAEREAEIAEVMKVHRRITRSRH